MKKYSKSKNFLILLLITALIVPAGYSFANEDTETNEKYAKQITAIGSYIERAFHIGEEIPLTNDELKTAIVDGTTWLTNAQSETGRFNYEYVPYENKYLEDDHIVRQGGALYALGEIARRSKNLNPETEKTITDTIAFFDDLSREDTRGEYTFKCVSHNDISSICLLGATSLALTGILGYVEHNPEKATEYADLIDSYLSYIMAMKKQGEGFQNTYRVGESSQDDTESAFSNGEALLALVRYYKVNPREDVKVMIDETFEYLKKKPYDTALYLWIMAALKDMRELWGNEEYITYGKAFTNWRVSRAGRFRGTARNYCAYIEGVVSAYSLLENSLTKDEALQLRSELDFWNTKNSRLQLTENDYYRVLPSKNSLTMGVLKNPTLAFGGFLTGEEEPTQRIDFTQHCIGAYVQTLVDIEGETL